MSVSVARGAAGAAPPSPAACTAQPARWWSWSFKARALVVFILAAAALVGVWLAMALVYGSVLSKVSPVPAREVVSAVTSSVGRSGEVDTTAILATPEYFNAIRESPGALGVDPGRNLVVLVALDTHVGDLPEPGAWIGGAVLEADGYRVTALSQHQVVARSDHHQSVALQFPKSAPDGRPLIAASIRRLQLSVPALAAGAAPAVMNWSLPLRYPDAAGPVPPATAATSLAGALALIAGLLVVFSPCALHLTGVFLPLITGLGTRDVMARAADRPFRARVVRLALAFVTGFILLYTAFGAAAGFAGRLLSNTSLLRPYLLPIRLATGAIVIYLALQALGFFRLPFVINLQLPTRPHVDRAQHGYLAAMLAGVNISAGCLACVGGTLLASLLLFAGTSGSPLVGGVTLFLFSTGVGIPFVLIALAFDHVLPRIPSVWRFIRYSSAVAAAVMLIVGLLILSGNESIFEELALSLLRVR